MCATTCLGGGGGTKVLVVAARVRVTVSDGACWICLGIGHPTSLSAAAPAPVTLSEVLSAKCAAAKATWARIVLLKAEVST